MIFNPGDRIQAIAGVCPGSLGVVKGIKSRAMSSRRDDVYHVRYDNGRNDSIFAYMLVLVEPIEPYEID